MDERILKWLYDIQIAVNEIEDFMSDAPSDFNEYKQNTMLKRAIERNLEIIGEATNRVIKADNVFKERIVGAEKIVALRNYVIHAYDNISDENIWAILNNHLPILKRDINFLIESSKED